MGNRLTSAVSNVVSLGHKKSKLGKEEKHDTLSIFLIELYWNGPSDLGSIGEFLSHKMNSSIINHNVWMNEDFVIHRVPGAGRSFRFFNNEFGGRMSPLARPINFNVNGIVLILRYNSSVQPIQDYLEIMLDLIRSREFSHPDQTDLSEIPVLVLIKMNSVDEDLDSANSVFPEKYKWKLVTYSDHKMDNIVEGFQWLVNNDPTANRTQP